MAYTKRKSYPRKRFVKRRTARAIASTALRKVTQITRGIELKKRDINTFLAPQQVIYGGSIHPLTLVSGGTTSPQRIGNEISVKYVNINGVVTKDPNPTHQIVRAMLLYDKQETAGQTPVVTDVLDPDAVSSSSAPFALLNRAFVGRFQILRSTRYFLSEDKPQIPVKLMLNFRKPHNVRYTGPSDVSNMKGSIYLLLISSDIINPPTFQGTVRLSFTDL